MELRHLETFRMVATLLSFNQAAEVLGYAQSTVSEQIKILEAHLNTPLFDRSGRQVALTKAGAILLQYSQRILNLEQEIRSEVGSSDQVHGTLSIRIPETVSTYFLPPALREFNRRYPKVNINFVNCSSFGLLNEFRSGIINLAFLITDEYQAKNIQTEKLLSLPLVMVTYPANPLADKGGIDLDDLQKETLLVPTADCNYTHMLEKMLELEKIRLSCVLKINCVEAIKEFLSSGTGIAVLPRIAVEQELVEKSLVELPWNNGPLSGDLLMIWQMQDYIPPIMDAFMKITRETLIPASDSILPAK